MTGAPTSTLRTHASTSLWGIYLACSWTWCIGMYLPVILINRLGWPGFIAFAVPNVLGCAAFGYVVKNRSRSDAMVAKHGGAMTWFSIVTVAYHMFFIVWLLTELVPVSRSTPWVPLAAAGIVWGLGVVFSFLPNRDWLVLAVLVYGASLVTLVTVGIDAIGVIAWHGRDNPIEFTWLTPVLILGFVLCPYLDLTFHRALQLSPSRHAFAVFGIAFFAMIWLTCMLWFPAERIQRELMSLGLAHILAQSVFTVGAHLREIRSSQAIKSNDKRIAAMMLPLAVAPVLYIARSFTESAEVGERLYLGFLAFYGLVFPLYVLVFMVWRVRQKNN